MWQVKESNYEPQHVVVNFGMTELHKFAHCDCPKLIMMSELEGFYGNFQQKTG